MNKQINNKLPLILESALSGVKLLRKGEVQLTWFIVIVHSHGSRFSFLHNTCLINLEREGNLLDLQKKNNLSFDSTDMHQLSTEQWKYTEIL